jgi:hypothetical protein
MFQRFTTLATAAATAAPAAGVPLIAATIVPTIAPAIALPREAEAALDFGDDVDPLVQMELAEVADRSLLRLVLCAAGATLALALTTSLI